tara:strand:- start:1500 stop:1652 length:153 start_codon:yes stop_codon:yes gene_type:complete
MKPNEGIELRVCKVCDAPLPFKPKNISYFNEDTKICDDCLALINDANKKK